MQVTEFMPVLVLLVAIAVVLVCFQRSRADQIVQRWAQATGVELVSAQRQYLYAGPFFLRHSRGQLVYRIVVRDQAGTERAGWLRVGGWLGGVLSEKTKVIWDS